jgi:NAD(P)-dependent dehydrogenase (short-subunit alcohol dehydrogenase family)
MTVLITGANRGVGAALLSGYRAAGQEVIGTARAPQGDLLPLDVTKPQSHRALADWLDGRPIDVLICNAGVFSDRGQRIDTGYPAEMWAEELATNVTGVFLTIQTFLPHLRAARGGRIAIISSQMGSTTRATGGSYIYRASKAAVLNLGRNLAVDLKPQDILVGVYHPGWVQTDMGGAGAEITPEESARGLMARIAALSPATTGCFETWDGRAHPV